MCVLKPFPLPDIQLRQRSTKWGGYEVRETDDGSWTVYSQHDDEHSHSSQGALQETWDCYFESPNIEKLARRGHLSVLEVGAGCGVAYHYLLQYLTSLNISCHLTYIGLERDPGLVAWGGELFPQKIGPYSSFHCLRFDGTDYRLQSDNLDVQILIGDARETIHQVTNQKCDVVFQDAFSYKNNPSLWTIEWFGDLFQKTHNQGQLTTFSAATRVRKALVEAGFMVTKGKRLSSKRGHTRAYKWGSRDQQLHEKLMASEINALKDSECMFL